MTRRERTHALALAGLLREADVLWEGDGFGGPAGSAEVSPVIGSLQALWATEAGALSLEALQTCRGGSKASGRLLAQAISCAGGQLLQRSPRSRGLQPILARLNGHSSQCECPIGLLSLDREALFPTQGQRAEDRTFTNLRGAMVKGLESMAQGVSRRDGDIAWAAEALAALLERVAWCVPSGEASGPQDVSLFDQARTVAAIAACLAWHDPSLRDPLLALTCVDISGIQPYLHALKSKGARKSLTGRSCYVQILQDAMATALLDRFDLPTACCIYQGGGKVWLLLPQETLEEVRRQVGAWDLELWRQTGGLLGVSCGAAPLAASDLPKGNIGAQWTNALRDLRGARRRRFIDLPHSSVFTPEPAGLHPCQQCEGETDHEHGQCDHCRLTEGIGRRLGRLVAACRGAPSNRNDGVWTPFDIDYALFIESPGPEQAIWLTPRLVDFDAFRGQLARGIVEVFWPIAASESIEYEALAERNPGVPRLGILRGDVDNLGQMFERGLPKEQQTLPRLASLSRTLSMFFGGHLPTWLRQEYPEEVRVVFSGGDDVFLVGSFHAMPEVAMQLRRHLRDFAGGNPHITLSAGLEVLRPRSPLIAGARRALAAEHVAKTFERPRGARTARKDAVVLFGVPLEWEEIERAGALAGRLATAVRGLEPSDARLQRCFFPQLPETRPNSLPRSVLQTLGLIASLRRAAQDVVPGTSALDRMVNSNRHRWIAAYALRRLAQRGRDRDPFLEFLRNALLDEGAPPGGVRSLVDYLAVSVEWAFLLTRSAT